MPLHFPIQKELTNPDILVSHLWYQVLQYLYKLCNFSGEALENRHPITTQVQLYLMWKVFNNNAPSNTWPIKICQLLSYYLGLFYIQYCLSVRLLKNKTLCCKQLENARKITLIDWFTLQKYIINSLTYLLHQLFYHR